MTDLLFEPPGLVQPSSRDNLRDALQESRQRWRQLVTMAADLAFETDAEGRFVLLIPETVLGWSAGSLIGQPSESLIGDDGSGVLFNPFRPVVATRKRRTWLRRAGGGGAIMSISSTPLHDAAGRVAGARGIAIDMTDSEALSDQLASRLRHEQALHHILSRVGHETDPDRKMDAALWALIHALGAEGAAIIGAVSDAAAIEVMHECGPGATAVLEAAAGLVMGRASEPGHITNIDGRLVLAIGCETRFATRAALAIWRTPNSGCWDNEDTALAGATVDIARMILEYEALQREMAHQASTDPLTGLLNRRAFMEETRRQIARLDRETELATLMFVDLDAFKGVNDRLGHAMGDQVLVRLADMLRGLVRPFDLITRLGGDEFAIWLGGADHMTAAERADFLCKTAPVDLQAILPEPFPKLGVSIGIATRRVGSHETVENLIRRADMAMDAVKRNGRRHWLVSLLDGD